MLTFLPLECNTQHPQFKGDEANLARGSRDSSHGQLTANKNSMVEGRCGAKMFSSRALQSRAVAREEADGKIFNIILKLMPL